MGVLGSIKKFVSTDNKELAVVGNNAMELEHIIVAGESLNKSAVDSMKEEMVQLILSDMQRNIGTCISTIEDAIPFWDIYKKDLTARLGH